MDTKEAIKLVISNDDLNFIQIRDAYDALKNTDYAELTKLYTMTRKKLENVQDSLFGMSLDEVFAAAEMADNITPEENRSSDEYKNMTKLFDDKLADFGYLTQAQKDFLQNYSSQMYGKKLTWADLTPEDKRLLMEEGKDHPNLMPTQKQLDFIKKAQKSTSSDELTQAQKDFLQNYSSQMYKDDVKWSDLTEDDRRLLQEEAKDNPSLLASNKKNNSQPRKEQNSKAQKNENTSNESHSNTEPVTEASETNDDNNQNKPQAPDQSAYELDVDTQDINAALLNRNYSHMALFADSVNPLDENNAEFASSRDALDMLDVKDENNNSIDVRDEIVETARVQTMAELLASKDKISKEQFNRQFRDNIDMMVFSIINADRVAELTKSGDTKTMRKEFGDMVNKFTAGGKKNKIEVKVDNVIGALSVANQKIANVSENLQKQFGNIPAVAAINNRLSKIDSKLTKKLGTKYVKAKAIVRGVSGIVTDLGLATLAGATGPVGLGIYAYYTFNKLAMPFFNAYRQETQNSNISLKQYAKQHKSDAAMAGLYTVSSILTVGIGAAVAAHNIANSAGATIADSFTKFASTGKIVAGAAAVGTKQVIDVHDAYKNGTSKDLTKAVAKAAGAVALFALAAEARNHYDLVPHGSHTADGTENEPRVINNIVNNYYDYSSHDTVYVDNCCDDNQYVPVQPNPEPTPVQPNPEPTPVQPNPEPTPVQPNPQPDPVPPTSEPDKTTTPPKPVAPIVEQTTSHQSVATEKAPDFVERDKAPDFVERDKAPDFVEKSKVPVVESDKDPVPTKTTPPTQSGTRVLANYGGDYSSTIDMLNDFQKNGVVEMENKTFYDANQSTDPEVKEAHMKTGEELKKLNQDTTREIIQKGAKFKGDFNSSAELLNALKQSRDHNL